MKWAAGVLDKNHSQSDQGTVMKNNKSLCIPQHILYNVSLNIAAHQIHNPAKSLSRELVSFYLPDMSDSFSSQKFLNNLSS